MFLGAELLLVPEVGAVSSLLGFQGLSLFRSSGFHLSLEAQAVLLVGSFSLLGIPCLGFLLIFIVQLISHLHVLVSFSLRCLSCSSGFCLLSPLNSSSLLRNLLIPGRLCAMMLFIQNVSVDATGTIIGLHLLLHNLGQVRSNSGNESLLDCVCCLSGDLRVRVGSLGSSAIVLDASSSLLKGLAEAESPGFRGGSYWEWPKA